MEPQWSPGHRRVCSHLDFRPAALGLRDPNRLLDEERIAGSVLRDACGDTLDRWVPTEELLRKGYRGRAVEGHQPRPWTAPFHVVGRDTRAGRFPRTSSGPRTSFRQRRPDISSLAASTQCRSSTTKTFRAARVCANFAITSTSRRRRVCAPIFGHRFVRVADRQQVEHDFAVTGCRSRDFPQLGRNTCPGRLPIQSADAEHGAQHSRQRVQRNRSAVCDSHRAITTSAANSLRRS